MPLLQSLEDDRVKKLKSLKYPSGQAPYVQKDILDPPTYNAFSAPITKRVDDVVRLGKMLLDTPGIKFVANQALLSQVDVLGKVLRGESKGIDKAALRGTANVLKSIFKQIPVNGTGTHFYQTPAGARYAYTEVTEEAKYAGIDAAALANFAGIVPIPFDQMSNLTTTAQDGTVGVAKTSLYGLDTPLVPSSLTREESLGAIEDSYDRSNPLRDSQASGSAFDFLSTRVNPVVNPNDFYQPQGEVEIGNQPEGKKKAITIQNSRYRDPSVNKETRVGLGNPGGREDRTDYSKIETVGQDEINMLDVGRGELPAGASEPTQQVDFVGRDLIKFRFYVDGTPLYFRAHLTAFDDSHN